MFENLWWAYVSIGIVLIIIEIFTPGFIIMWFGISSIIAAIPVYFEASTKTVILTYSISLLFLTLFVRKITVDYFTKKSKGILTNTARLVGQHGIVTEEVNVISSKGMVKVGRELWSAIPQNNDKIEKNEEVTVCGINGVKLIVRKIGGM